MNPLVDINVVLDVLLIVVGWASAVALDVWVPALPVFATVAEWVDVQVCVRVLTPTSGRILKERAVVIKVMTEPLRNRGAL